jgi:hypothetical protein
LENNQRFKGSKMTITKLGIAAVLGAALIFAGSIAPAYAATKVDCDAVMTALNSGKHAKDVAKDMSISTSSVYRCKKHAKEAAKAETKAMTAANKDKAVPSPAAMASASEMPPPPASAPEKK